MLELAPLKKEKEKNTASNEEKFLKIQNKFHSDNLPFCILIAMES
jgi:hypothetical protein